MSVFILAGLLLVPYTWSDRGLTFKATTGTLFSAPASDGGSYPRMMLDAPRYFAQQGLIAVVIFGALLALKKKD